MNTILRNSSFQQHFSFPLLPINYYLQIFSDTHTPLKKRQTFCILNLRNSVDPNISFFEIFLSLFLRPFDAPAREPYLMNFQFHHPPVKEGNFQDPSQGCCVYLPSRHFILTCVPRSLCVPKRHARVSSASLARSLRPRVFHEWARLQLGHNTIRDNILPLD